MDGIATVNALFTSYDISMIKDEENQEVNLDEENNQDAPEAPAEEAPADGDPLDSIQDENALKVIASQYGVSKDEIDSAEDREGLLALTKKGRAMSTRKDRKKETPAEEPTKEPKKDDNPYLTKEDFHKSNEKKALRIAKDSDNPELQAIVENWDDSIDFYVPRNGKETAEDILEDMKDAYAVFLRHNPPKEEEANANDLTKQPKTRSQSPKHEGKERSRTIPKATSPQDWYKKED